MYCRKSTCLIGIWGSLALSVLMLPGCATAMERRQITYDVVKSEARNLAAQPYRKPDSNLPAFFRDLDYEGYREIEFKQDQALWLNEQLPFQVQFFHRGYLFKDPVRIYEFTDTHVQELPYVRDFFRFRALDVPEFPGRSAGYAGWRLYTNLNSEKYLDEFLVFLGASYFRSVGKDQLYGLSARGLVLPHDPGQPEEFPSFTAFWLHKPEPGSSDMTLYAMLDGPSLSGAYRIRIQPGESTRIDVTATLYPRKTIPAIGLGGLTSMFYYGENSFPKPDDFRPEVHDSDGLGLEYADGRRLWRPLDVGPSERVSRLPADDLMAFGLYQRDRSFNSYLDSESHYHRRPSVRMTTENGFVGGNVVLRELTPDKDFFDNIVAFYEPAQSLEPGQEYTYSYSLEWGAFKEPLPVAKVTSTRHGADIHDSNKEVFLVEFSIPSSVENFNPALVVELTNGARVVQQSLFVDSEQKRVLANIQVVPGDQQEGSVDVTASLKQKDQTVSEIWTYRWNPYN